MYKRLLVLAMVVLGAASAAIAERLPYPEHEIANVAAFARLYGVARFFCPSDAAAELDWDRFAVHGVSKARYAADQATFRDTLLRLFAPSAPASRSRRGCPLRLGRGRGASRRLALLRAGFRGDDVPGPYLGKRTNRALLPPRSTASSGTSRCFPRRRSRGGRSASRPGSARRRPRRRAGDDRAPHRPRGQVDRLSRQHDEASRARRRVASLHDRDGRTGRRVQGDRRSDGVRSGDRRLRRVRAPGEGPGRDVFSRSIRDPGFEEPDETKAAPWYRTGTSRAAIVSRPRPTPPRGGDSSASRRPLATRHAGARPGLSARAGRTRRPRPRAGALGPGAALDRGRGGPDQPRAAEVPRRPRRRDRRDRRRPESPDGPVPSSASPTSSSSGTSSGTSTPTGPRPASNGRSASSPHWSTRARRPRAPRSATPSEGAWPTPATATAPSSIPSTRGASLTSRWRSLLGDRLAITASSAEDAPVGAVVTAIDGVPAARRIAELTPSSPARTAGGERRWPLSSASARRARRRRSTWSRAASGPYALVRRYAPARRVAAGTGRGNRPGSLVRRPHARGMSKVGPALEALAKAQASSSTCAVIRGMPEAAPPHLLAHRRPTAGCCRADRRTLRKSGRVERLRVGRRAGEAAHREDGRLPRTRERSATRSR